MTFEKALEAMKQGKVVERDEWDGKLKICMYHNAIYTFPFLRDFLNLRTHDITAPDWQIYEPVKEINQDAFKSVKIEPHKEEPIMYTDLEITFKSGETITYSKGEWDDYSYDGKAVAVKKDGAWVGLYNFDNVFCVELKSRED
jgi:hypothetical protein